MRFAAAYKVGYPIALAAVGALVLVLSHQQRALRRDYQELLARTRVPHAGSYVPPFDAVALDGQRARIADGGEGVRQVLFVFNTACPFCLASAPAWREIGAVLDTMTALDVQAYGISVDEPGVTARYAEQQGFRFPVVHLDSRRLRALYRAGVVPQTLVIDGSGEVIYARIGEVTARAVVDSILAAVRWRRKPASPP